MSESLRILLTSLIDYAGLFPPASLSMEDAVRRYDSYRRGEFAWALGRFVVPAARMHEVPSDFPLSVLAEPPFPDVDVIESLWRPALSRPGGLKARPYSGTTTIYIEITDLAQLASLPEGARAKIRTGGVTPEAFPSTDFVASFLNTCKVPFKATAGLHHPIRCIKPLTYEPNAPRGTMHGFVNVFLAATGNTAILEDDNPDNFHFADDGVRWRDVFISNDALRAMRRRAVSFGSCSFEEPIADLQELGWL